jgi:hypothetical protein
MNRIRTCSRGSSPLLPRWKRTSRFGGNVKGYLHLAFFKRREA